MRGAVLVSIKQIELFPFDDQEYTYLDRDIDAEIEKRSEMQAAYLLLIPKEATVSYTAPFGRLNAFSGLVSSLSPKVIKPHVEDCSVTKNDHGAAIISQNYVSTTILRNSIKEILESGLALLEDLSLGYKFTNEFGVYGIYKKLLENPVTIKTSASYSFSDWVEHVMGYPIAINPYTCDGLGYYLCSNEGTRNARIQEYLENCDQLSCLLLVLVHLTSGPPPRATEIASLLYRNTLSYDSSIVISNGYLCLVYSTYMNIYVFLENTT